MLFYIKSKMRQTVQSEKVCVHRKAETINECGVELREKARLLKLSSRRFLIGDWSGSTRVGSREGER